MSFLDAHNGCGCCGFHATEAMLNHLSLQMVERAAMDFAGLERVIREEDSDAPFVTGEVRLTQLLAENAAELADEVEVPILAALDRAYVDEAAILTALATAQGLWENKAWGNSLEQGYRDVLSATAIKGAHGVAFSPLLSDTERLRVVNGMSRSAKYYTNRYFNTQVMPAIADAAHAAILNGVSHDGKELEAIHALLDRRLRSVPYWNLVANGAASRAYHYGYIKAGVAAGRLTVTFTAKLDERTSDICIRLNGTQWRSADVSLLLDRIADANGDEIKLIAPWPKEADIENMDAAGLLAMGVVVPPVHGRCRSQLIFD